MELNLNVTVKFPLAKENQFSDAIRCHALDLINGRCYVDADKLCSRFADEGHPEAMYIVGHARMLACNVGQLPTEFIIGAVQWLQKASNQGHPLATFELGKYYYFQTRDYQNARLCFKKLDSPACPPGLPPKERAEVNRYLGIMYYDGLGGEKDPVNAIQHYTSAAYAGDTEAQFLLGFMELFFYPPGPFGLTHLQDAANQRHAEATFWLGYYYARIGNTEVARIQFEKAAHLDHPVACYYLGNHYLESTNTYLHAKSYYMKATQLGCTYSAQILQYLDQFNWNAVCHSN